MLRQIYHFCKNCYLLLKSYKELNFRLFDIFNFTRLYRSKKLSAQDYLNYKTLLKDASFRESFLSYNEADEYWKILNPNKYSAIARDKYLTHLVLEKAEIPTTKLYAYYNHEAGSDYNHIREQLIKNNVRQCVIKPAADSAHGSGVFVCNCIHYYESDCLIEKTNGETLPLKQLLESNKHTPLLFEERVIQTPQISLINSSSVNTVRFMTALYPNLEVKVIATFMKIGRKGSDIDNAGGGGNVDCGIDIESGRCYNTIQFNSFTDVKHVEKHPDSLTQIDNLVIDNWQSILTEVKSFQSRLPFIKMIGWDIALTDNGPIVIEINNWWDTTGQLFIGKGWRSEVLDCYNAWKEYYNDLQ